MSRHSLTVLCVSRFEYDLNSVPFLWEGISVSTEWIYLNQTEKAEGNIQIFHTKPKSTHLKQKKNEVTPPPRASDLPKCGLFKTQITAY